MLIISLRRQRDELIGLSRDLGFDATAVESIEGALEVLTQQLVFPVVLLSATSKGHRAPLVWPEVMAGVIAVGKASPDSRIVLIVDESVDAARCCEAINSGVAGFVEVRDARMSPGQFENALERALRRFETLRTEAEKLHRGEIFRETGIVGVSRAMAGLLSQAARAAHVSDAPVLIYGESGTGKQLLAETIHRLDPKRSSRPFICVNCAAITGTLAESALFGHVKGAFTGATAARDGYFLAADGGTVLLDEIGELSLDLQPKLLRLLQEGMVLPVGSDHERPVDVRVVAAANRRIPVLIEQGCFRLDLYQRLNVIALEIPPLRDRREDIALLIDFFVSKYAARYGKKVTRVHARVYEWLCSCPLRGNVRELENAVRRAIAIKQDGDELQLGDLPPSILNRLANPAEISSPVLTREVVENACRLIADGKLTLVQFVDECERVVLAHALRDESRNHEEVAARLGFSTRTFYNKRRKHHL